jgi:hypothetical protein
MSDFEAVLHSYPFSFRSTDTLQRVARQAGGYWPECWFKSDHPHEKGQCGMSEMRRMAARG